MRNILFGLFIPFFSLYGGQEKVLNVPDISGKPASAGHVVSAKEIGQKLRKQALGMKSKFYEAGRMDYHRLRASSEYAAYISLAADLTTADLLSLTSKAEKISFWINVYNALVVHGVIAFDVKKSVQDVPSFFDRTSYNINGYNFTLNDIEHGILRANRSSGNALPRPFLKNDPRLKFALTKIEMDPRIHFALNCASRSCPPIAFFSSENLETQLETATQGFILSDSEIKDKVIYVSKIFEWYGSDFMPDVRSFLRLHSQGPLKKALEEKLPITFKDYNWNLNAIGK